MTITPDTNVLVRIFVDDDPLQAQAARSEFVRAVAIVATTPALCELVWVLKSRYAFNRDQIADALEHLLQVDKMIADDALVQAGIAALRTGGDFADAVIAYDGRRLGGVTFVSFDRKAINSLNRSGASARAPELQ